MTTPDQNGKAPDRCSGSEAINQTTPPDHTATPASIANPMYPAHGTQPARLLAVLLVGKHVNPLYAWTRLGIYRLSDTAFRLRGMGWPVDTGRLDVQNRFAEPCHVANYRLPGDAIKQAGDLGQEFARSELEMMTRRAA